MPYHGCVPVTQTLEPSSTYIMFISNVGELATLACSVTYTLAALDTSIPTMVNHAVPAVALSAEAGGPTSARAMKASCSLVCNTPSLRRGGRVLILNCQQRLRFPGSGITGLTKANWNTFITSINAHPDTKKYDLTHFGEEREVVAHVVNNSDYYRYDEWHGSSNASRFFDHISVFQGSLGESTAVRPMSTLVLIIQAPSGNDADQTFTLTPHGSWYTRHAVDTLPGQAQVPVPTAPLPAVNAMHSHAMSSRHDLLTHAQSALGFMQGAAELAAQFSSVMA